MELKEAIIKRWSPRSYNDRMVAPELLEQLFEAARWAPSCNNEQEWSYYYTTRDYPEKHQAFCDCLHDKNRLWAQQAPVIMISVGRKKFAYNGQENRHWMHDVGAANVSIALQAAELGLQLHQMAGFDIEKCARFLDLDLDEVEPVTMMVVGYPDTPDKLPEELREREMLPRVRKTQEEFAFECK